MDRLTEAEATNVDDDCRMAASQRGNKSKTMVNPISIDPEIMHGAPVFVGTRVPVQTLFDYLEGGDTLDEFLRGFPTVPRRLALDALEEARNLLLSRSS